ncbi:MAG: fimbrillin family protein, partial [Tidjanibacter sp.]|nr:fimbrillin family protein [Tidjanibacter sp.]
LSGVTYDIPAKSVAITDFPTTQGTDLLIAKRTGINYDPVNPTVALQFSHMMSQISIQGANADDGLEIEITNIRFVGKAQASYDGTEWTQHGAAATLAQSSTSTELLQGTYKTLLENILVVPNAIDSDMRIIITYTVNGAMKPNRTIPLSAASLTSLEPGKKYIYKFTLDPAGNIIFERPTVDTWGSIYGGTFVVDPDPGSND